MYGETMGKFAVMSFILIGIYMWGFLTGLYTVDSSIVTATSTNSTFLISQLKDIYNMQSGYFWSSILSIVGGVGLGLVIGFIYKDLDKGVATGIFTTVIGFMWQASQGLQQIFSSSQAMRFFNLAIVAPILLFYFWTFLEWWRLKD